MHTGGSCSPKPGPQTPWHWLKWCSLLDPRTSSLLLSSHSLRTPLEGGNTGPLCPLRWACLTPAFTYFERARLTCKLDGPQECTLNGLAYTSLTEKAVFRFTIGATNGTPVNLVNVLIVGVRTLNEFWVRFSNTYCHFQGEARCRVTLVSTGTLWKLCTESEDLLFLDTVVRS